MGAASIPLAERQTAKGVKAFEGRGRRNNAVRKLDATSRSSCAVVQVHARVPSDNNRFLPLSIRPQRGRTSAGAESTSRVPKQSKLAITGRARDEACFGSSANRRRRYSSGKQLPLAGSTWATALIGGRGRAIGNRRIGGTPSVGRVPSSGRGPRPLESSGRHGGLADQRTARSAVQSSTRGTGQQNAYLRYGIIRYTRGGCCIGTLVWRTLVHVYYCHRQNKNSGASPSEARLPARARCLPRARSRHTGRQSVREGLALGAGQLKELLAVLI